MSCANDDPFIIDLLTLKIIILCKQFTLDYYETYDTAAVVNTIRPEL